MRSQHILPDFSRLFTSRRTNAQARSGRTHDRRFSPELIGLEQKALLAAVPTVLNVTSSKLVSTYGDQIVLNASVNVPANTARPSVGTVTFYDAVNGKSWITLGTVPLANGHAVLTTKSLSKGQNQITAVYSGDGSNFEASAFPANPYPVIKTVAGGRLPSGPALHVGISPRSVVSDAAGNLFFTNQNTVLEYHVDTQRISVVAGSGVSGFSGDGGPATAATLRFPTGLAISKNGDLFFGDGNRGRKVQAASGIITTVAGDGSFGHQGDGGPATKAQLENVAALVFDSRGNLLVSDYSTVRKINPVTGVITLVAGTGTAGYSGDGGQATVAQINGCNALAIDSKGDLFLSDWQNNVVRKVDKKTGTITTIAGDGKSGFRGDGGNAKYAQLNNPGPLAIDKQGNLLIADYWNNRVRKVSLATGIISTVGGTHFSNPTGLALDSRGNLFVTDQPANVIRRIDAVTGSISVIAGNGTEGLKGDGGQASNAQLVYPLGFAIDLDGNLYVADSNNFVVRKISAATGIITTIAGNGLQGWANDGVPATAESLMFPGSLAFDTTHNLFIGEAYLGIIHRVDTATGLIYRVAGNGDRGYTGDGGLATNASFNWPAGIAIDGAGNLFIADSKNNVIREVFASTGIVQTVAGTGVAGSSGDGGPAIEAQLNDPAKIGVDFNGNLYIADTSTNTIRRVDSLSHTITTFAGQGAFSGYAANGKPAKDVSLSMDYDGTITIDPNGNLWVRDYNTGLMKINTQTGIVTTPIDVSLLKETPSYAVNIAVDAVGNVFLSENENMRVRAALVSSLQITVNAEVPTPPAVSVTKAAVTTVPSGPNKTANVVVVQFSGLLNPKDAIKTSIYGLRSLATAKAKAKTIAVSKAVYDAATQTVKLYTGAKLKAGDAYVLTIQQGNLHDTFNRPLNLKKSGIFQLKFS